eukprot:14492142-Alexandrium_andersonii.AAC.1
MLVQDPGQSPTARGKLPAWEGGPLDKRWQRQPLRTEGWDGRSLSGSAPKNIPYPQALLSSAVPGWATPHRTPSPISASGAPAGPIRRQGICANIWHRTHPSRALSANFEAVPGISHSPGSSSLGRCPPVIGGGWRARCRSSNSEGRSEVATPLRSTRGTAGRTPMQLPSRGARR